MFEKELLQLNLKPDEKINIWVRFCNEPLTGVYQEVLSQTIFWKSEHASHAKNLNELVKVERV
jgi:hypothetical protein